MTKMMKLTDGGKMLVDSLGRAKEAKCCCTSTADCTICSGAGVAATTAIATLSGVSGPLAGGSTICGTQCSTFNGTFYLPFFLSSNSGGNWTCAWRLAIPTACSVPEIEVVAFYKSALNITELYLRNVTGASAMNYLFMQTYNGRIDCHGTFNLPYAGAAPSTSWYCDFWNGTATVVLS